MKRKRKKDTITFLKLMSTIGQPHKSTNRVTNGQGTLEFTVVTILKIPIRFLDGSIIIIIREEKKK